MSGNIPLDPSKWETPKQRGIGRIVVCRYQTTDDSKTRDGVTFTEFYGYPRPAQTWHVQIERLDGVYVNKVTGEKSPMSRYQTLQLERYDAERKTWRPQTQGDNKNQYIIERWMKAGCRLADPEELEGTVIEYEIEMTHKFNGNIAKNLLYPLKVLARPGQAYEFRGEVEEFEFDPDREGATSLDQAAEEVSQTQTRQSGGAKAKLDEATIVGMLVGVSATDEDAIGEFVGAHKAEIDSPTRTALVSGLFVEKALTDGKLVVVDDAYALP